MTYLKWKQDYSPATQSPNLVLFLLHKLKCQTKALTTVIMAILPLSPLIAPVITARRFNGLNSSSTWLLPLIPDTSPFPHPSLQSIVCQLRNQGSQLISAKPQKHKCEQARNSDHRVEWGWSTVCLRKEVMGLVGEERYFEGILQWVFFLKIFWPCCTWYMGS